MERNFQNYNDYQNYIKKQQENKNRDFSIKFSTLIPYLLFVFVSLFILYKFINHISQNLQSIAWDDSVGEVLNVSIIDSRLKKVFNFDITFSYFDNHQYLIKSNKMEVIGYKKVRQYKQKYFPHAKIKLKINPNNRADVIIKPDYLGDILFTLVFVTFFLAFGIIFPFIAITNNTKDKKNIYINESQKKREALQSKQEQLFKMQKIQELIYLIKKIHKLQ